MSKISVGSLRVVDYYAHAKGIETFEGVIAPILFGQHLEVHSIDMPGGLYCAPHCHDNESLIYTATGKWTLISEGQRRQMLPGSLVHVPCNKEIGLDVDPASNSIILVFSAPVAMTEEQFVAYLHTLKKKPKETA